jgi:pimeloyl-ACP methyl ester carboxylesterase
MDSRPAESCPRPSLHTFYFFDPIPVASSLRLPVLVLQGEKDIQILASKDAVALRKAFSGNDAFTYREFPSLSHNFKLVKDENKENGFGGPLPAEVTTAITEWMAKR